MREAGPQPGSPWPRLWAGGRRWLVSAVVALGLLQALSMAGMAWGIRASFLALHQPATVPVQTLATVVMAGLLLALARWQEIRLAERLGQRYANELRIRLFEAASGAVTPGRGGGADRMLLQRLSGDMGAVRLWIGKGMLRSLVSACRLGTLGLILVWWMPAPVAGGLLATLALGLAGMYLVSGRLAAVHRRLYRARADLSGFLAERLPHASALRMAGRMDREAAALAHRTGRLERQAVGRQKLNGLMRAVPDAVRGLAVAWVLLAATTLGLGTADTAACLAMVGLMIPGLRDLAGIWDRRAAWLVVRKRWQPWLQPCARTHPPARKPPRIEPVGAADGHTGILSLLPGEKVLLQAQDAGARREWFQAIAQAAAQQKPLPDGLPASASITLVDGHAPVLQGSLRRAATFGSQRRPGDARVLNVLRNVGLQGLVDRLGGLDGRVGRSGEGLSEDERARLLLARAMLSRSDLVLLDALPLAMTPELGDAIGRWLGRCRSTVLVAEAYAEAIKGRGMPVWRLRRA